MINMPGKIEGRMYKVAVVPREIRAGLAEIL